MLQDRNIHRDAQALRKVISGQILAPAAGVDQDEPLFAILPRHNFRISDLQVSAQVVTTAPAIVKVQAVPRYAAVGSPQLAQGSGVATFSVEEFWQKKFDTNDFANVAAIAAQAFTEPFTVLDGFWGVALVVVDQSENVGVIANSPIQAFATEEIALANCPSPRLFSGASGTQTGRVAILTIEANGGDFIAGTTNTDDAVVASFNTAPQDGHVAGVLGPFNEMGLPGTTLGQQLKDASGTNILQGQGSGGDNDSQGDALVCTVRSSGAPVITGGVAHVEYRPWPAGGEGLGDTSVSQNRPSFVP